MGFSCWLFGGDELHAQFVGAQSELAHDPLAVSLFVVGRALVGVFLALGEHVVLLTLLNGISAQRLRTAKPIHQCR